MNTQNYSINQYPLQLYSNDKFPIQQYPQIHQYPQLLQYPQIQQYPQLLQYPQSQLQEFPIQQYPIQQYPIHQSVENRNWNSNICDCFMSNNCCLAFVCPCCIFRNIILDIDKDSGCCKSCFCCIMPFSVFIHSPYRKKLRVKYNLQESPCNDFCVSLCCPICALVQEMNEIEYQNKPQIQSMN